ncbi:alcohol dehydrogenase catalytic domain-containing protein [Pseudomonas koreensis]|uniref:alcohol dehydrogenase catalytic domain-containing protein n=1 Tax=Pseudomonas koreensis TaxID=198620 RepID=UPI0034A046A4
MKAVVFHDVGDIRLDDVADPVIQEPTDAVVRITAAAICGTDLHFIRGTVPDMQPGTILGHEGVGIIEALGDDVRNLKVGDRVIIPSPIACGNFSYCRAGYFSQCDVVNPHGKQAGTSFFGGPKGTGPFHGLQAEKARIPYAHIGLIKIPQAISDDQAIAMSDIFPTAWFGAQMAEIRDGDSVAVFGDIYPAVMDTPGFRDGANFTSHALTPPPPVYDPRQVARAMVACALQPRNSTTVGAAATIARIAHFLLPAFPLVSGWLTRTALQRAPHSATSLGNLFGPASGKRRIEGGWRQTRRTPYWSVAASAALLLGGVVIARKHSTNNKPHN